LIEHFYEVILAIENPRNAHKNFGFCSSEDELFLEPAVGKNGAGWGKDDAK